MAIERSLPDFPYLNEALRLCDTYTYVNLSKKERNVCVCVACKSTIVLPGKLQPTATPFSR